MRWPENAHACWVLRRTTRETIFRGGDASTFLFNKECDMHIDTVRPLIATNDEGLLAGPAEDSVRSLGVVDRVLALFRPDFAALCPDLVHEAQLGLERQ